MSSRREGRGRQSNKQFFILFHAVSLAVSIGLSVLVIYFFVIPYGELKKQGDAGMEMSAKISQIQISMSGDASKEKVHPSDILDLRQQILELKSGLEVSKHRNLELEKKIEGDEELLAEQASRISKLEANCITGLRLGSVQWTPINGGHGYKDEYGYVITGLINYSFDDSADQVHRRPLETYVNGSWTRI